MYLHSKIDIEEGAFKANDMEGMTEGIKIVEYALESIRQKKRIAGLMEKSCAKKKKEFENFVKSTDNIRRDLEDGRKGRCHTVPRRHVIRYFCQ